MECMPTCDMCVCVCVCVGREGGGRGYMCNVCVSCLNCSQRREDMTSHRSDNLHALITFQGKESRMQVTRIALWTKSRWALSVFY